MLPREAEFVSEWIDLSGGWHVMCFSGPTDWTLSHIRTYLYLVLLLFATLTMFIMTYHPIGLDMYIVWVRLHIEEEHSREKRRDNESNGRQVCILCFQIWDRILCHVSSDCGIRRWFRFWLCIQWGKIFKLISNFYSSVFKWAVWAKKCERTELAGRFMWGVVAQWLEGNWRSEDP